MLNVVAKSEGRPVRHKDGGGRENGDRGKVGDERREGRNNNENNVIPRRNTGRGTTLQVSLCKGGTRMHLRLFTRESCQKTTLTMEQQPTMHASPGIYISAVVPSSNIRPRI